MPYPAKRKAYVIWRSDQTYMVYDLTEKDFKMLGDAWAESRPCAMTSIGIIGLSDVRAIVEHVEPEPTPQESQPAVSIGEMTHEELQYLNELVGPFYRQGKEDDITEWQ